MTALWARTWSARRCVTRLLLTPHVQVGAQVGSHLRDLSTGEAVEVFAGPPTTTADCY
ncbi:hypothetical protein PR003_g22484 [Phytophthora rubi]|uniref:Uncharacterized protein n=1 Tax=Phytophthora rubi TaxID=129364 RepID=A0A6A3JN86_9STRA|nr:hypothetical protein PR001_g20274 [Phytophthora rubi]KAE8996184.1 hypothetical protein PR002_g19401 [Phytophthora rubi]KAE9301583.1 hypothetical protein PR003_g22484 [Phytophthora rubi]